MNNITLKPLDKSDLKFLREIYTFYALNTTAVSFTNAMTIEQLKTFIPLYSDRYKAYIINDNEIPSGFCYYTRFKPREAFDCTVEVTLFLKPGHTKRGIGSKALQLMETDIYNRGYKNIVASITSENRASMNLFEKCGYTCCGQMKNAAEKFGRKLDLMTYQKNI